MQEEVTQKTIALSVKTARVTADVLKNMLRKYLSGQKQKGKNSYKVGKQSYKELKSQGSGLSNIEITDGNIKSFERVAKKYRLDFALKKDSSTKPPTYYVFFKGQDTEMMNLAFKKYLGVQMNKKDKPSIMKKLMHFKDAVSKGKNRERAREQQKDSLSSAELLDNLSGSCSLSLFSFPSYPYIDISSSNSLATIKQQDSKNKSTIPAIIIIIKSITSHPPM